ncbi:MULTISPECIES: hypothetical protein [Sorangium]|uniref:Uncharacterized protein n=1 Tax=Sorangium cellulosum TaxID=56 RepID=A0A4P2QLY3_SORCE|nr:MULTISPECIES: hypothetical protein [Sorangium]AUX30846.1 hypothetical protein SOCE836_029600 [Sorangium cellulosum]WCQ90226.1 hypothetical protein NQZ70_02928 [Sorangium sp. Soce836]
MPSVNLRALRGSGLRVRGSLRTPSEDGRIEFRQFHQPALESGTYKIEIQQIVQSPKIPQQTYPKHLSFAVLGERFGPLGPEDIVAMFPPPGSVGEHANVLPHVTLGRSTLPWERLPGLVDEDRSWMALLLLRASDFADEGVEKPRVQTITLGELLQTPAATARFPTERIRLEEGQQASDEVTVIDVQWKTLEPLLPTAEELALLAHAHQRVAADETPEGDLDATVICNRLPEPNGTSTVHLVSLEKRYPSGAFDAQGAEPNDWIRLVSLASWKFDSVDPEQSFSALLKELDRQPAELRAPVPEALPPASPAAAYLEQGYVPLPHRMRRASKTVSFYRGPFVPGVSAEEVTLPAECADELVRYDPETGMFDVSYAAAWELGRLRTLANTRVALELLRWTRESAQQRHAMRQRAARRLPLRRARSEAVEMPEVVVEWLADLELLVGLPFSYLVPDERLLPVEGLRFFSVDPAWVECLLDGARSVGRVTNADVEHARTLRASRSEGPRVTGLLMRSSVVSGWPSLLVEGYAERLPDMSIPPTSQALTPLRFDRLAEDTLLALFAGEVKTLDVFQAPEALHYGLDANEAEGEAYTKNPRDASGTSRPETVTVPWRHADRRVVDIAELATRMKALLALGRSELPSTGAQFALQMIEGVERVRFVASS